MSSPAEAWKAQRAIKPAWMDALDTTDKGVIKATPYNIDHILRNHEELVGRLRHNTLANRVEVSAACSWAPPGNGDWRPWRDSAATRLAAWLGNIDHVGVNVPDQRVYGAAVAVAEDSPHNPVADYLSTLRWDGTERLSTLLPDYFGTDRNDYTTALGINWMVSAVARAMDPGCQVQFMLILEGGQGIGKTRSVRALAGPDWYAEAQESPVAKDFYQSLIGKWMIEIGEMSAFTKAESSVVKQAITRASDYYRASYAHTAQDHLRACVFVGTTNEHAYLRDATGARRFYPVICSECSVDAITANRDQLWAEAAQLYEQRHAYWLEPPGAVEEQEERFAADSWDDVIGAWLEGEFGIDRYPIDWRAGNGTPVEECSVTDVLRWAIAAETSKHTRADQTRVGQILTHRKWRPARPLRNGRRVRVFTRPPT